MYRSKEELQKEAVDNARANLVANAKAALDAYADALRINESGTDPVMGSPRRIARLHERVEKAIAAIKEHDEQHGTEVTENVEQ